MTEPLIVLPHTGLHVPHTRLRVSSLKTLRTPDGAAFTATLRLDGRIVGAIHNDGNGGATTWSAAGSGSRRHDLDAFVAACRTDDGIATLEEHVLDDLVDEYESARTVANADLAGHTALRLRQLINGITFTVGEATAKPITTPAHRGRLVAELAAASPAGADEWWQLWHGTVWEDLTPRPAPSTDEAVTP
jgi:hypothetical protein